MTKYLVVVFGLIVLACVNAQASTTEMEYPFPNCGNSQLNEQRNSKVCASKDFIAKTIKRPSAFEEFIATVVSGGHGYMRSSQSPWRVIDLENKELDMQGHVWDFSKQAGATLILQGHDGSIKNGTILGTYTSLGQNTYYAPNFTTKQQNNNIAISEVGFLYADNNYNCKIVGGARCVDSHKYKENLFLKQIKIGQGDISLSSWGGGIVSSTLVMNRNIEIAGSKATILNNQIISQANPFNDYQIFLPQINSQSKLTDSSKQIFPYPMTDRIAIPCILYVKFSPDTVIDGNTFTLTHKNDQAYAIVLDHSLRVRITNNTFNGFKVPILMDQWSSIVDDKGNVMNPNQFAGDVEMNRKGVIVKK